MNISSRNSSFDYSMETSDSDDTESAFGGYASSILSNLDESIGKIDTYLAIERGFIPGDIIRSVQDTSQMGRIVNVDMVVDLEDNYGEIMKDVNSTWLQKVHPIAEGDYVVHDSWLGKVDTVCSEVTVLLDDGSKHELTSSDLESVASISTDFSEDGHFVYYPGQRVKLDILACNKLSRWFCSSSDGGSGEGTVSAVSISSVLVNWIASVLASDGIDVPAPSPVQDVQSLTLLSCFSHANWQLGDCCKLHPDYLWKISHEQDLLHIKSQDHFRMSRQAKRLSFEPLYTISKTRTKVDVSWQDGSCSIGLDVRDLIPVGMVGDHDFWPGQIVLDRNTFEKPDPSSVRQLGVVKTVDSRECVLAVKWVDQIGQFGKSTAGTIEESVSAYELIEHPDYSFCLGDIIFRLLPGVDHFKENYLSYVDKQTQSCGLSDSDPYLHHLIEQNIVPDILGDHCNNAFIYLSCIGSVVGVIDECIEVKWANGITSKVGLDEIVGLGKIDIYTSRQMLTQEAANPKGTTELDVHSLNNKGMVESENNNIKDQTEETFQTSSAALFTRSIIGLFSKFASYVSSLTGPKFVPLDAWSNHCNGNKVFHQELASMNLDEVEPIHFQTEVTELYEEPTFQKDVMNSNLDQFQASKVVDLEINVGIDETGRKFKQFDIVNDCVDHHFASDIGQEQTLLQAKRCWLKKVRQEWNNLEKGLPDNIYVRAYEERMDLLRACIVGSDSTPYNDALFFFDICFPPEYPHKPPMVHYISGGLRLNPNLYESGKVCLSLLNTWMGTGTEVWNSGSSSILQVLLSIQALVLNAKPYFNEAGFDKEIGRAEAERNSEFYNENAFLLSRKSMLYHLLRPPKHFEALVEDHFTQRAVHILSSCKAYLDGSKAEYDIKSGEIDPENPCNVSNGFKMILKKLLPKLVLAFTERGIDCSEFNDQVISISEVNKESS